MNREIDAFTCDTTDPTDLLNLSPETTEAIFSNVNVRVNLAPPGCGASPAMIIPKLPTWSVETAQGFVLMAAPPRCGSGQAMVIPNLLKWCADTTGPTDPLDNAKLTLPQATQKLLARAGIHKANT